jgi:hypothetical protein
MKCFVSIIVAAIVSCLALKSHAQSLTADEVQEAMKSPEVRAAFLKCVEGKPHADLVKLEIVITREGTFSLASTDPHVDSATRDCFGGVAASIKLHPIDRSYKMVYSLSLAPSPDQTSAAPAGKNLWLDPNIKEIFEHDYKSGMNAIIAGTVLCGLSVAGIWLSWLPHLARDDSSGLLALSIAMKVGFGLTAVTGLILIIWGASRMSKALRERNKRFFSLVALSPDPSFKGVLVSSVWHF